jgi:CRISPR-associated protein Cas5d
MACFTRPENKVERVSYPVMTPSAARGVLEAIYWKPEFDYRIREIDVLAPIRYASLLRNEVCHKASSRGADTIWADSENERAQRNSLILWSSADGEIAYVIRADVVPRPHEDAPAAKHRDIFRRRVERGQCFHMPYLGCREFSCSFGWPHSGEKPIAESRDLGLMLFDIAFDPNGPGVPLFFEARLDRGTLHVPDALYAQREALRQ